MDEHPDMPAIMQKVGEVTVRWNGVELVRWYQIFCLLLHELPSDKSGKIFKNCRTGAQQRELAKKIATHAFKKHAELGKEFNELLERTKCISELRNQVIHSDYFVTLAEEEIIIATYKHQKSAKESVSLASKPLGPELDKLLDKIASLAKDLLSFEKRMRRPETGFLPDHLIGDPPLSEILRR